MNHHSILNIIMALSILALACQRDTNDNQGETDEALADSSLVIPEGVIEDMPPLPVPPPKPEDKALQKANEKKSPFQNIGCCADEAQRVQQDCCCPAVLEGYKKMLTEADIEKLAELMLKDPILGDCREKMKQAFEDVENPPLEEEDLI